jgi:hypothetical protein
MPLDFPYLMGSVSGRPKFPVPMRETAPVLFLDINSRPATSYHSHASLPPIPASLLSATLPIPRLAPPFIPAPPPLGNHPTSPTRRFPVPLAPRVGRSCPHVHMYACNYLPAKHIQTHTSLPSIPFGNPPIPTPRSRAFPLPLPLPLLGNPPHYSHASLPSIPASLPLPPLGNPSHSHASFPLPSRSHASLPSIPAAPPVPVPSQLS